MSTLPPELWLEVFALLPHIDLASASLVCQRFRDLAQPLQFTNITFSPCKLTTELSRRRYHTDSVLISLSDDEQLSLLDKLSFCQTPRIAARLLRCTIGVPLGTTDSTDPSINNRILHDIFSTLSYLNSVEEIEVTKVDLTPFHFSQMRAMQALRSLVVKSCYMATPELPNLPLSRVCLYDDFLIPPSPFSLLVHILQPASLRTLDVFSLDISYLIPELVRVGPWPALRELSVVITPASQPSLVQLLYQCTQLEELYFQDNYLFSDAPPLCLPPTAVPNLIAYRGPLAAVPAAMAGRAIRRLEIGPAGSPPDVEVTLPSLGDACARLETLHMDVDALSHGLFAAIATHCTGLRELYIINNGSWTEPCRWSTAEGLHFLARARFPPNIASLRVIAPCPVPQGDALPEAVEALWKALTLYGKLRDVLVRIGEDEVYFDPLIRR